MAKQTKKAGKSVLEKRREKKSKQEPAAKQRKSARAVGG